MLGLSVVEFARIPRQPVILANPTTLILIIHEMLEACRFQTQPYDCSYIPGEIARLDYRLIVKMEAGDYVRLLDRGWRRFGIHFFRPACADCCACQSLRIDVPRFVLAQRHRRNLKKNARIEVVVRRPTLTEQHIDLYDKYHADMHRRRGWPERTTNPEDYAESFLAGDWEFAREFLYLDEGRLVGVGLADVLPNALSSIYFFHDPQWRSAGPGIFSVLKQLEFARDRQLRHQYLGYWVPQCPSMSYKAQYRRHEILNGYPDDADDPVWVEGRESP